jgi:hypothetical protein
MQRDALYIADLVESTRTVRDYLDGMSRERWDNDRVLRDAVLLLASPDPGWPRRLSLQSQQQHQHIR